MAFSPTDNHVVSYPMENYAPRGYHKFAALMSLDPDVAIFHRFSDLGFLTLLSLQAEIIKMQKDLRRICMIDDHHGDQDEPMFSQSFALSREKNSDQHQLLQAIRPKLKEYYDMSLQIAQINNLSQPRASQLRDLQTELNNPVNAFLQDDELETWASPSTATYISLRPQHRSGDDAFTKLIEDCIVGPYHRYLGHRLQSGKLMDAETGTRSYDGRRVAKAGGLVAIILSAILPVLAIFVLNRLSTTDQRIGMTVFFTAVFAVILSTFSSARMVEIFAATATFAAVEVVFIGSALNSGGSGSEST